MDCFCYVKTTRLYVATYSAHSSLDMPIVYI